MTTTNAEMKLQNKRQMLVIKVKTEPHRFWNFISGSQCASHTTSGLEGDLAVLTNSLVSCLFSSCGFLHDLLDKYKATVLHWRDDVCLTLNPSNAFTPWKAGTKGPVINSKKEAKSMRRPRAGLLGHSWGFCTLRRIHIPLRVPKNPGFVKCPTYKSPYKSILAVLA